MRSSSKSLCLLPIVFLMALWAWSPGDARAEVGVSVNINLGPPPIVVSEPPEVVMVPQSRVYFVPDPHVDVFFYAGYWWSPRGTRWYRASAYNGPWVHIAPSAVPRTVIYMPRDYRTRYARERRIEYAHWSRERARWEKENWKAHKRWEKEREQEWKRQARRDRYERHDDRRHDGRDDRRHGGRDDGRRGGRDDGRHDGRDDGRRGAHHGPDHR
jgi:hypothetical protein